MPLPYLRTSSSYSPPASGARKRKAERSDSIRPMGFEKDLERNVGRL
jgi:hypothetical protein